MGHTLSAPIRSKYLEQYGTPQFRIGVVEMQGYRINMEDEHTVELALPHHPDVALFGIYDGHGGDVASAFISEKLPSLVDSLEDPIGNERALLDMFLHADKNFCDTNDDAHHGTTACIAVVRTNRASSASASTTSTSSSSTSTTNSTSSTSSSTNNTPSTNSTPSTTSTTSSSTTTSTSSPSTPLTITSYTITICNVGDSRCFVIDAQGNVRFVTEDHKPSNELEMQRIVDAGGWVTGDRVDGQLAMSRSFGDRVYKADDSIAWDSQKVICVPDITRIECVPGEKLFICCDGIVEKMSNEEVTEIIHNKLQESPSDPVRIVSDVIDASLRRGSMDNMSAMLIQFEDGSAYPHKCEFVSGPLSRPEISFRNAFVQFGKRHGISESECLRLGRQAQEDAPSIALAGTASASNGPIVGVPVRKRGSVSLLASSSAANLSSQSDDDDDD